MPNFGKSWTLGNRQPSYKVLGRPIEENACRLQTSNPGHDSWKAIVGKEMRAAMDHTGRSNATGFLISVPDAQRYTPAGGQRFGQSSAQPSYAATGQQGLVPPSSAPFQLPPNVRAMQASDYLNQKPLGTKAVPWHLRRPDNWPTPHIRAATALPPLVYTSSRLGGRNCDGVALQRSISKVLDYDLAVARR